jgi:N-acetyl-gamma-glutamyl-phosphate reductase
MRRRAAKVFIDGEVGTTGLQVRGWLAKHPEIDVVSLPPGARKDASARRDALRSADAAVLCLPDDAAREAVAMLDGADTIVVDASTAHRVSPGWTYGFPELAPGHAEELAGSKRIANPGCYPTGFIGLVRPLVSAGLLPSDALLTVHAVSGYSGGGKGLVDLFEGGEPHEPWGAYGFNLNHKHTPEMARWTGLATEPIFCPSVGNFKQGMCVSVNLRASQLAKGTGLAEIHSALSTHYAGKRFVTVAPPNPMDKLERGAFMRPDVLNNTNELELFCFGNDEKGTYWLLARLDNLGKGASGACVQNLNLALGFDESVGLV